jgi:hypothetical protein
MERELGEVRRQKERVEEKMMQQYKSPSPPKKSKGTTSFTYWLVSFFRFSWKVEIIGQVQIIGFQEISILRTDRTCTFEDGT